MSYSERLRTLQRLRQPPKQNATEPRLQTPGRRDASAGAQYSGMLGSAATALNRGANEMGREPISADVQSAVLRQQPGTHTARAPVSQSDWNPGAQSASDQLTVRVSVRLRPVLRTLDGPQAEKLPQLIVDEGTNAVQIPGDAESLRAPKAYKFHSVFGPTASATDIYRDVLTAPVDCLLDDGYNVAIFAYGQTGSGKTFTMAGSDDSLGIASLVFRHIFEGSGSLGGESGTNAPAISLSIMEIYNEVVYDLLNNRSKVDMKTAKSSADSAISSGSTLRFVNLMEYPVRTQDQALRLMRRGMEGKTMGPNYQHDHSSRSHTVVRLVMNGRDGRDKRDASLMLVDLAGSEAAHDNSSALATSEGKAIGKSLFQLRQCVHALSAGKRPDYRVSKLTRLLEPALTRGYVSVICTTGIGVSNFRQVADTLEFGMQAQVVQLNPNSEWDTGVKAEIASLQDALHKAEERNVSLRRELQQARIASGTGGNRESAQLIDTVRQLQQQAKEAATKNAETLHQLDEAHKIKDMMEAQLLALMETAGSAEVALREERQCRASAESTLQTLESQYETAVFALHERESGELTEKMLQKQEQLRVHVRELEKALHEREEDERARERAMHAIQQQNETLHLELQQASAALAELRMRVGRDGASSSWRGSPTGSWAGSAQPKTDPKKERHTAHGHDLPSSDSQQTHHRQPDQELTAVNELTNIRQQLYGADDLSNRLSATDEMGPARFRGEKSGFLDLSAVENVISRLEAQLRAKVKS